MRGILVKKDVTSVLCFLIVVAVWLAMLYVLSDYAAGKAEGWNLKR
ncbi:MAG: hypothetical protein RSF90_05065 [Pygmaiobacter sp.]